MKCPSCGQWNRSWNPRCSKCGEPLPLDRENQPEWKQKLKDGGKAYIRVDDEGEIQVSTDSRDDLAREMAELKLRKEEGRRQQRSMQRKLSQQTDTKSSMVIRTHASVEGFWNAEKKSNASRVTVQQDGAQEQEAVSASMADYTDEWQGGYAYDPLYNTQKTYTPYKLPQTTRMTAVIPSRTLRLRRFLQFLLVVLIAALTGLCVFFGYHYYLDHFKTETYESKASVTASMMDELASHTILIPGEDGQQIYIRELHASYVVTGGFATVEIADHTWYDDSNEYLGETKQVTLTPYVKTSSGRQVPLEVIQYDISIPLSPIDLISPDGMRAEVATAMYSMQFNVRPGSTVTVNGEDVSDTVSSSTGDMTYNATVQPIGDNVFTVKVRSQYCRENTMVITLYREPQEIPLDLAADTYNTTTSSSIEINATTLPGANVEVLSPHSDLNITNVDTTGKFSFYAVFDHIGYNTIIIEASYPGKKTSRVQYDMYYVPPASVYTPKAWPLSSASDYSELLSNISVRAERTQIYVASGTVAYSVSDKPQMIVMYTSDDGKSQPVLLENRTRTTWKEGTRYRIYADAYSTYNGMPWLIARYTYADD